MKNFFWQKDVIYLDNSNDTSFRSIGHRHDKLFNFSTFFVNNSNDTSFRSIRHRNSNNSNDPSIRSIGHRNSKLFNFSTFFVQFWSFWRGKNDPQGGLWEVGEKEFFGKKMCFM